MSKPLRVPVSVASRKGVSWLNETARQRRVLLTRFGRVDAVVDSPERLDEAVAQVHAAAGAIVGRYADAAADRHPAKRSLDEVCAELGLDVDRIHARAADLRASQG